MKNKFLFLLFSFSLVITLLSFVSATTYLDSNTILNANSSNSTMTFSIPIYVENISIEDSNITLTDVQCTNGASNVSSVFFNTPNSNKDSSEFCIPDSLAFSILKLMVGFFALAILGGSLYVLKYLYDQGNLNPKTFIAVFMFILLAIILLNIIAQSVLESGV